MGKELENQIKAFSKEAGEPGFLLNRRLHAHKQLEKNPTTVFRHGLNIVTRFEADWEKLSLLKPARFEISGGKAKAANLADCLSEKALSGSLTETPEFENMLLSMNAAFLNSGAVIRIPKDTDAGTIHLKLNPTGADFSHVIIAAEEGSKATVIEEISGEGSHRSSVVEMSAAENSDVRFGSVQTLKNCRSYAYRRAAVGKDAKAEWLDISTGSSISRNETYSDLIGQGSKSSMFSFFFGHKEQQFDLLTKCTHVGRNTESLMMTSGALQGKSKAINQGFARIERKAYGANANQKAKILLLNEGAKAAPIPKLEIDNNEVAATHEASVGQIDYEDIFYIMSRGLDEKSARKLYVEGFFDQYASRIGSEKIREDVQAIVQKRMSE